MKRGYGDNRYPFWQIGDLVKFENGVFETEDVALQALIESRPEFGVHIHPRETAEELAAGEEEDRRQSPRVHAGLKGSADQPAKKK
jgi:hypothetical protein